MRKWFKQYRMELLHIRRRWLLMVAPLAFAGLMVYAFFVKETHVYDPDNAYVQLYDFLYLGHTLSLGIAMLLGVLVIRRDTQRRVAEMVDTWPVGNGTWLLAKYAAGLTYLSLYALTIAVLATAVFTATDVTFFESRPYVVFLTLQAELSYAVTLALGMALAMWIPHRIVYLIAFCAWMFGTFFMEIFILGRFNAFYFKTFHLSQFIRNTPWSTDVWGVGLVENELLRSRLFVLSFTFLLLVAMVVTRFIRRSGKTVRLWQGGLVLVAAWSIVALVWYEMPWIAYRHDVQKYPVVDNDERYENETPPFAVERYDLRVKKSKSGQGLTVKATMELDGRQLREFKVVPFTLHHTFKVKDVRVNGVQATYRRVRDALFLDGADVPRDGQVTIDVDYAGDVFIRYRYGDGLHAFVRDEQLFLPHDMAWYPFPGDQLLYVHEKRTRPGHLIVVAPKHGKGDVAMDLSVSGFAHRVYGTLHEKRSAAGEQQFAGKIGDGVLLFSGDVTELAYRDTRLVTSPFNAKQGGLFLRQWHDRVKTYYEAWLFNESAAEEPSFMYYLPFTHDFFSSRINDGFFINERLVPSLRRKHSLDEFSLFSYLFKDDSVFWSSDDNVMGAVRSAFIYVYLREQARMSHEESLRRSWSLPPDEADDTPSAQVFDMLGKAMEAGQADRVKALLRHFYPRAAAAYDPRQADEHTLTWDEWNAQWKAFGLP